MKIITVYNNKKIKCKQIRAYFCTRKIVFKLVQSTQLYTENSENTETRTPRERKINRNVKCKQITKENKIQQQEYNM